MNRLGESRRAEINRLQVNSKHSVLKSISDDVSTIVRRDIRFQSISSWRPIYTNLAHDAGLVVVFGRGQGQEWISNEFGVGNTGRLE